jgi:hypothetical protein
MPFVNDLLQYLNNNTFIETGTFRGDTLEIVLESTKNKPINIISLELSDVFFDRCVKRFENVPNIHIVKGNSKYDLYETISTITSQITFWLDSHWSGTDNVGCDNITVCPILEELEQIKLHPIKTHTIMIDDIRLMNGNLNKYEGFPVQINDILSKLYEINSNYCIKYYDDYTANNDVLVAYIEPPLNV